MNYHRFKLDISPTNHRATTIEADMSDPPAVLVDKALLTAEKARADALEAENMRLEQLCLDNFTNWIEARKKVDKIQALLDTHGLTAGVLWCRVREVLNAPDMGDGHG